MPCVPVGQGQSRDGWPEPVDRAHLIMLLQVHGQPHNRPVKVGCDPRLTEERIPPDLSTECRVSQISMMVPLLSQKF